MGSRNFFRSKSKRMVEVQSVPREPLVAYLPRYALCDRSPTFHPANTCCEMMMSNKSALARQKGERPAKAAHLFDKRSGLGGMAQSLAMVCSQCTCPGGLKSACNTGLCRPSSVQEGAHHLRRCRCCKTLRNQSLEVVLRKRSNAAGPYRGPKVGAILSPGAQNPYPATFLWQRPASSVLNCNIIHGELFLQCAKIFVKRGFGSLLTLRLGWQPIQAQSNSSYEIEGER